MANPRQTKIDPRTGGPRKKRYVTVATAEKWWVEQARLNPARFIEYLTGLQPAKHHLMWLANIFNFDKKSGKFRLQFVAPRESAKTTIMVYALVWFISRYPWLSNLVISVSAQQAQDRLAMARDIIEHDPRFKNVFPWIKIDQRLRNTVNQFSVYSEATFDSKSGRIKPIRYNVWRSILQRNGSLKDPTLYAAGAGGKGVIGRRISGMAILDDIVDESHLREYLQEEMYDYIMRTVSPCIQDYGKIINIMTRWMNNDVADLIKQNDAWHSIEIQALRTTDDGEDVSYWPGVWPVQRLLEKKKEVGPTMFAVMYQNDPLALTNAKFEPGMLHTPLPEVLPKFSGGLYIGTDFAMSEKSSADWTVFAAVGIDKDYNIFILEWRRMRVTPDRVVNELGKFSDHIHSKNSRLDDIIIEKVGFQTSMRFSLVEKFPHLHATPVPPIGSKGHRLDLLARKTNDGEVFFNTSDPVHKQFVRECLNFPHHHDDTLDAVTLVLQHISQSATKAKTTYIRSPYLT